MTTIINRLGILQNLAQGKGVVMPQLSVAVTPTAAVNSSGYFSSSIRVNSLGSTPPGTLVQMLSKDDATNQMLSVFNSTVASTSGKNTYLGRFYRIGGVVLTATGNQWTHDAATFPLTRTIMGQTANVNLIPVVYVTTVLATTAAQFIIKDSGGGTGYTNQSGNSVVGTQTFVFPSNVTIAGGAYIPMLEVGDSAVQDIVQVDVTVSATGGACDIYGFEPMMMASQLTAGAYPAVHNAAIGAMTFTDTKPAVATSGTVTSYKGFLALSEVTNNWSGIDIEVSNQ